MDVKYRLDRTKKDLLLYCVPFSVTATFTVKRVFIQRKCAKSREGESVLVQRQTQASLVLMRVSSVLSIEAIVR